MAKVLRVNGPLVTLALPGARNGGQVRVGALGLIGEIIALHADGAVAQMYESTEGLRPGDWVEALGYPLSVELGPGLLGGIFDGVQRPLDVLRARSGDTLPRGLQVPALARERAWGFNPHPLALGIPITGGMRLGVVQETPLLEHRILVPPNVTGELLWLAPPGDYTLEQPIARLRGADGVEQALWLYHRWPVRTPRPYRRRLDVIASLLTGQRVLDTFFPLAKGGKAAIPGPFGAGKTMVQQQIARWADAQVVIYVGCGERGNELADVLESFPKLTDPRSGRPLMERTLLVANTSNMPVVAREASIYISVTLAEYFRDQGYDVLMVADSTSRWAEALREVAGRLGQMPVEEGYPAYLAARLAAFYERAGRFETLEGALGSVTLIGTVSPPGGDFSEPVTSHTKGIVSTFWALSKELADARHYPAVDWNESYSGALAVAAEGWRAHGDAQWRSRRGQALALLAEADELARVVNLVGPEALSHAQRWALEGAALLREAVLQQSALDPVDSYCAPERQSLLLELTLQVYECGQRLLTQGVPVQRLLAAPLLSQMRRLKTRYGNDQLDALRTLGVHLCAEFARLSVAAGTPPETVP